MVLGVVVTLGWTTGLDDGAAHLFRSATGALLGPRWFQEMGRDVTGLGSLTVLGLVLACAAAHLAAAGRRRGAAVLLIGVLSGVALCFLSKVPFGRARPVGTIGAPPVFTASFPSAHSMTSVILFGLIALMVRQASPRPALVRCTMVSAIVACGLIGLSRLYLGVHWLTDILAGWCGGLFWVTVVWSIAERFCAADPDIRSDQV